MMTWWNLNFQDANSPIMEEFIFFHDYAMLTLIFIISAVFLFMVMFSFSKSVDLNLSESQILESIWTLIPGIILIQLAIPSLSLLYMLEEDKECSLSVKAVGHQWYWSYEMNSMETVSFDSYMIGDEDSAVRLLEVDNRLVLPVALPVRILTCSADVLHAWTVPSFGVKADACPGRVNQLSFLVNRPGVFFGQCSEICGANHSFMPIVVEAVSVKDFISWISN